MPVGAVEKVHEVDAQCLICLTCLPILDAAGSFEILTETPDLIRQRFVRGGACHEPPDPANEIGGSGRPDHLAPEEELRKLLQ